MIADLFWVKYEDKHAAALVFKKIQENAKELGVACIGLEKVNSKSRRVRSTFRILIGVTKEKSQDLPGLLRIVKNSLQDHPLFAYMSFDFHVIPVLSQNWNLDSYDDSDYQKIFINKRKAVL